VHAPTYFLASLAGKGNRQRQVPSQPWKKQFTATKSHTHRPRQGDQGGHYPPKFLAYLVILCFWKAVSQKPKLLVNSQKTCPLQDFRVAAPLAVQHRILARHASLSQSNTTAQTVMSFRSVHAYRRKAIHERMLRHKPVCYGDNYTPVCTFGTTTEVVG